MKKNLQSIFNARQYMLSEDFEIYYYNDSHFPGVKPHTHDYYEFYYFLQGNISMHIDDHSYTLRTGDIILVPPGISHYAQSHDDSIPYHRFVFWISRDFFERLAEISPDYRYMATYTSEHQKYIYHNDMVDFNAIQAKLLRLIEEISSARFGRDAKISLCVNDLILHMNRMAYEANHPQRRKERQALYENIMHYIEDHLEQDLSLERLAQVFYVSKYHIAHIFKDNLGLSVHQYITKKRLAACRDALLIEPNISKTFLLYGFKDYSGFFRAFKKEYGISPKEYQELHRM